LGIAILISDRADFTAYKVIRDKRKRHDNDEEDAEILNTSKETKTGGNARRIGWIHYASWRLQHCSISNGHIQQAENQDTVKLNKTTNKLDIIAYSK
jgi:hypothetical protein